MSGQLPISIGQLAQLKTLSLPGNSLRGTIPTQLADLRYLRTLHLADNHLTGPIPAPLGQLRELEEVDLARNYLFGPLPVPTGEQGLLRVSVVDLSHNRLQGRAPFFVLRFGPEVLCLFWTRSLGFDVLQFPRLLCLKLPRSAT